MNFRIRKTSNWPLTSPSLRFGRLPKWYSEWSLTSRKTSFFFPNKFLTSNFPFTQTLLWICYSKKGPFCQQSSPCPCIRWWTICWWWFSLGGSAAIGWRRICFCGEKMLWLVFVEFGLQKWDLNTRLVLHCWLSVSFERITPLVSSPAHLKDLVSFLTLNIWFGHLRKIAQITPGFLWFCPDFCDLVQIQSVIELFVKQQNNALDVP